MRPTHVILNERRKELGLTYEAVHAKLEAYRWPPGVEPPSLSVIGHWFNGTRRPRNMQHLRGLCDVLGMSLDEAVKGAAHEAQTGTEQVMLNRMRHMTDADIEVLLAMADRLAKV